ncbi:hypothetical protein ACSQ5K_24225 [Pseudomonas sp. PhalM4]
MEVITSAFDNKLDRDSEADNSIASRLSRNEGLFNHPLKNQGTHKSTPISLQRSPEIFFVALFAENTAPKRLWESDSVENAFKEIHAGGKRIRETEAGKLIVEATEYYILEELSTHLTDYFGQSELESKRLQELSREDIPDIVFNNRFLDTFSRPMRERAALSASRTPPSIFSQLCFPDLAGFATRDLT